MPSFRPPLQVEARYPYVLAAIVTARTGSELVTSDDRATRPLARRAHLPAAGVDAGLSWSFGMTPVCWSASMGFEYPQPRASLPSAFGCRCGGADDEEPRRQSRRVVCGHGPRIRGARSDTVASPCPVRLC
ncbi:MAG: hypothetical protein ACRELB_11715, partial [Polyangiaceae bacterium]